MIDILRKECKLSASILSFLFIAFGFMFFLPGYPILCGAFFTTLGIFQSFQSAREANDIVFSALLPIAKQDVVKGKYVFACFIELCSFVLMAVSALVRMTFLKDAAVYRNNALMNANFFALGMALVMFGLFNLIFIGGFFKTAYRFSKPFVTYIIAAFLTLGLAESLHHVPGLSSVNAFAFDALLLQLLLLLGGIVLYVLMTVLSCKRAIRDFENIDL